MASSRSRLQHRQSSLEIMRRIMTCPSWSLMADWENLAMGELAKWIVVIGPLNAGLSILLGERDR